MDFLTPSLPFIRALQLYGWLAWPMKLLSALGSEPFFLVLLPLVYWNINRPLGARLGVLLLLGFALNDVLKVAFALPRPFWTPGIGQLAPRGETSFGFPSGHAQSTAALWSYLALQTRRRRLWLALAFVLLVLIALSRLYLGAHYPLDVIGGALIGYALLFGFVRLEKPLLRWWHRRALPAKIGALALSCAWMGALYWLAARRLALPAQTSPGFEAYVGASAGLSFASRVGALFGLGLGLALMPQIAPFGVEATRALKILRFIVGIAVLAALRFGVLKILPVSLASSFGVYVALTLWVTVGAPWLFGRLGWMEIETRTREVVAARS